jgi:PiT family inorganic phosphate transporter
MFIMWALVGGIFMGWSLGANDAANVFGPAVAVGALRFRTAALLASMLVMVGAIVLGSRGFDTYDALGAQSVVSSLVIMLTAGATVALMTYAGLPVSTTQAVVGAIIGAGLVNGTATFAPLPRIALSWVLAPIGSMVIAFLILRVLETFPGARPARFLGHSAVVRVGLILATCYSAFFLGANNIANVTGVYVSSGLLTPIWGALIGAAAIGLGIFTFSGRVIRTVGTKLVELDPTGALIVVLAAAVSLNAFALIGVPVSASQAVVGGVLGVGLAKGVRTVNCRRLGGIALGWLGTPAVACALSAGGTSLAAWVMSLL